MARKPDSRDRCDHCRKWISQHQQGRLGSLEGIVSSGADINWAICDRCFTQKVSDTQYWDHWVMRQKIKVQGNHS